MRLMPPEAFADVFEPLVGQRCGVVDLLGNPGDRMLQLATRQLLQCYGIEFRTINPVCDPTDWCDVLLLGAGGNMGRTCPYHGCRLIRQAALDTSVPCVVLPQSFWSPEPSPFRRVYVRERPSMAHAPGATLAPDLALGLDWPAVEPATQDVGIFLRRDLEQSGPRRGTDPVHGAWTPAAYIAKAARHRHVVTDRLHFAIAGLIARRRVTLLPGSYHKNRGLWESWLQALGCLWSDTPPSPEPCREEDVRSRGPSSPGPRGFRTPESETAGADSGR